MAYVSKETKAALAPAIRAVLKKYGVKGTIAVRNHSALVVTIREGALDFIGEANQFNREYAERTGQRFYPVTDYYQANPYKGEDAYSDPTVGAFFKELTAAMRGDIWYDNSDIMTDYFDIAYYLYINIGRWDKPYAYTGVMAAA